MKYEFKVKGMHCKSCEILIKDALEELSGIKEITISHKTGILKVSFDESQLSKEKIIDIIKKEGYEAK